MNVIGEKVKVAEHLELPVKQPGQREHSRLRELPPPPPPPLPGSAAPRAPLRRQ